MNVVIAAASWAEIREGPAFGFTVVALIIVFGPLVAERLRLPGLLGLLVFGAVIGPNMLDVLPSFGTLDAVGDIGVLYLIFLAGLQLDIESFMRNRRISVGFGLLTAFIPLVLGTMAAVALDIDFTASLLIGSFWASFTLITYPTMSHYGLTRNRAVIALVGASSITDTISLIILALIIGAETSDSSGVWLTVSIALGLVALGVWCFAVVPWVARWFFSGLGQERTLRYMLVLIGLTSSAVVAEVVGIEALIGAFFVGVGLNRIVPNASPLMSVTDFFGNAFFIPSFLVSVGLLFDPEVLLVWSTIRLAMGFAAALIVGKVLAAWLSGRLFGLSGAEVGLLFSVSVAQAAATLAATIVGLEAGLYGDDVVNAVMIVVAVSLIVTSIGTARYAPQIPPPHEDRRRLGEAILVPVHRDSDQLRLAFALGAKLAQPVGGVLQPLVIATSTDPGAIDVARRRQAEADQILKRLGQDVETELRIDRSVATGLSQSAIEAESSMLLLSWPGPEGVRAAVLGANYAEIVRATALPVGIAALHDTPPRRVVLVARPSDLVAGEVPTLQLGVETAATLTGGDDPLIVGPLAPDAIAGTGIALPERVEHRDGPAGIVAWVAEATEPGDLVILPMRDAELRAAAIGVFESGRSIMGVAHNPSSLSGLTGTPMTLPVAGSLGPS